MEAGSYFLKIGNLFNSFATKTASTVEKSLTQETGANASEAGTAALDAQQPTNDIIDIKKNVYLLALKQTVGERLESIVKNVEGNFKAPDKTSQNTVLPQKSESAPPPKTSDLPKAFTPQTQSQAQIPQPQTPEPANLQKGSTQASLMAQANLTATPEKSGAPFVRAQEALVLQHLGDELDKRAKKEEPPALKTAAPAKESPANLILPKATPATTAENLKAQTPVKTQTPTAQTAQSEPQPKSATLKPGGNFTLNAVTPQTAKSLGATSSDNRSATQSGVKTPATARQEDPAASKILLNQSPLPKISVPQAAAGKPSETLNKPGAANLTTETKTPAAQTPPAAPQIQTQAKTSLTQNSLPKMTTLDAAQIPGKSQSQASTPGFAPTQGLPATPGAKAAVQSAQPDAKAQSTPAQANMATSAQVQAKTQMLQQPLPSITAASVTPKTPIAANTVSGLPQAQTKTGTAGSITLTPPAPALKPQPPLQTVAAAPGPLQAQIKSELPGDRTTVTPAPAFKPQTSAQSLTAAPSGNLAKTPITAPADTKSSISQQTQINIQAPAPKPPAAATTPPVPPSGIKIDNAVKLTPELKPQTQEPQKPEIKAEAVTPKITPPLPKAVEIPKPPIESFKEEIPEPPRTLEALKPEPGKIEDNLIPKLQPQMPEITVTGKTLSMSKAQAKAESKEPAAEPQTPKIEAELNAKATLAPQAKLIASPKAVATANSPENPAVILQQDVRLKAQNVDRIKTETATVVADKTTVQAAKLPPPIISSFAFELKEKTSSSKRSEEAPKAAKKSEDKETLIPAPEVTEVPRTAKLRDKEQEAIDAIRAIQKDLPPAEEAPAKAKSESKPASTPVKEIKIDASELLKEFPALEQAGLLPETKKTATEPAEAGQPKPKSVSAKESNEAQSPPAEKKAVSPAPKSSGAKHTPGLPGNEYQPFVISDSGDDRIKASHHEVSEASKDRPLFGNTQTLRYVSFSVGGEAERVAPKAVVKGEYVGSELKGEIKEIQQTEQSFNSSADQQGEKDFRWFKDDKTKLLKTKSTGEVLAGTESLETDSGINIKDRASFKSLLDRSLLQTTQAELTQLSQQPSLRHTLHASKFASAEFGSDLKKSYKEIES